MNVVALLSWYDEPVSWLAETVASLGKLADHVVAVDGAYALWPDSTRRPMSDPIQADTITRTAAGVGIGCTVHTPTGPWWGNEVEKRDRMLQIGQTIADDGDWYLIIDADETLTRAPHDTRRRLEDSEHDVAEVTLRERSDGVDSRTPLRRLYRAQPGLRFEQAHYVVTAPDGRVLSGAHRVHDLEPSVALYDVVVDHRSRHRPKERRLLKGRYYADRDELGIERVCEVAGAG